MGFTAPGVVFVPTDGAASTPLSIREHAHARRERERKSVKEKDRWKDERLSRTTRVASLDKESLENV